MSENSDKRSALIFGFGLLFLIITVLVLFGIGKYTGAAKDQAVDLLKKSAPAKSGEKDPEINSADAPYMKNNLEGSEESSSLDVGSSIADYGFKMDVEKAAQQKDTIQEYAVPSVGPGQPGSQEWQEQFWKER